MIKNKETASNLFFLNHVPTDEERSISLSHCHICLKKTKLTKEHIPPEKAFNNCNKLWDRLIHAEHVINSRTIHIRGGLWVKTLCKDCNNDLCSKYAQEYVKFTRYLVESPRIWDQSGEARLLNLNIDPLLIAKEMTTMILAVEPISFSHWNKKLREFVLKPHLTIDPPFTFYSFLVPDVKEAGTISTYHTRVETFAPGYGFAGGEISTFPFGFLYTNSIGSGYRPDKMTDVSNWFRESYKGSNTVVKLYSHVTGADSIQCLVRNIKRNRPQIDCFAEKYN